MSDSTGADTRVTVRLSPSRLAKLDAIAATDKMSRSRVLHRLIDGGAASPSSEALDEDALVTLMEERARNGSTSAIKWLAEWRRGNREIARLRELTTDAGADSSL